MFRNFSKDIWDFKDFISFYELFQLHLTRVTASGKFPDFKFLFNFDCFP